MNKNHKLFKSSEHTVRCVSRTYKIYEWKDDLLYFAEHTAKIIFRRCQRLDLLKD